MTACGGCGRRDRLCCGRRWGRGPLHDPPAVHYHSSPSVRLCVPCRYERERKDAEEKNEILELRSMGIRALLNKKPELGGSRS